MVKWLYIMALLELYNGDDPPDCSPNLEFSKEKQKIIK